jgi:phosphoribosylamine---glycine ligase
MTRVLIVGSGAREHALAWKLRQSLEVSELYAAPGNPGTASIARNMPVSATDVPALVRLVEECDIELTLVGPEAPLALGLADALRATGRRVVGPNAAAARIESSKSFAKELMLRSGVPTARHAVYDDMDDALRYVAAAEYPLVIKADGLTSGKGVTICRHAFEAQATILEMMAHGRFDGAGKRVVIEDYLEGQEVSLIAFVDGERAVPLPAAQDHKRLGEGDTGPNTGGMGAYAPVPFLAAEDLDALTALTLQPVVDTLAELGTPYRGILFAGLILTEAGPRVLEYNCRFGDPEAQVILPLLEGDILPWLEDLAIGRLEASVPVSDGAAVGVVLASEGYPGSPLVGRPINGLDRIPVGVLAFLAGTAMDESGHIVTAGGRVVTVVGISTTVDGAAERAYSADVQFAGMQRRRDIAWQARCTAAPPRVSPSGIDRAEIGAIVSTAVPFRVEGHAPRRRFRIAVLASGEGSNLQVLIDACTSGSLEAEIALVASHNDGAGALQRAVDACIPTATVPLTNRLDPICRREHEAALLELLTPVDPDLIVLAGWMLVLSRDFLERCRCPLLNVHPALLPIEGSPLDVPVLRGAHAVRDALAFGLPYTGVSVHEVTAEVDAGPVVAREVVPILPEDDEHSLYRRVKTVEHRLLEEAVAAVLVSTPYGGVHA